MKKLLLFLFFLPAVPVSIFAQTDGQRLDEVMQAATDAGIFNGVALVVRNDSVLLFKAYGWRDVERRIPHDTNSVFQIGSVTKQFTATVILWLQKQGKLNIHDKLSKYFPRYQYANRITIQNLLTHTSGIYNFTDAHYMKDLGDKPYSQQTFWSVVGDKPLDFTPDSKFQYSNSNYMILGYLIEKVSGKSYEQMVREVIFNKAGMVHSGFDYANLSSPYKSVGYDTLNERVHIRARKGDSSATYAAGGMYTTARDLYRWNLALQNNAIISQASLDEAYTPYRDNYGYGWYIETVAGIKNVVHNGGIWGFQAHNKRFPHDRGCIILLRNEMLGFQDYALSLHRIYVHDSNYYIPRKEITLGEDSLLAFTGHYDLKDKPEFRAEIVVANGHLQLTWTNLAPQEIFAEKKDFFHFKVYNMQLAFTRNGDGRVDGFSAIGNGQVFVYRKQ